MTRASITIRYRDGVLDPEAATIQRSLLGLGFGEVEAVRKMKRIELELGLTDRDAARERVEQMCEQLLANPVIEAYEIELRD